MTPPEQNQSPVAAAVQAVAAEAAASAPQPPAEPTIQIAGMTFFNVCQYVGTKPLRQVVQLRQGLWQIQREQNCLVAQQLPEKVWLTQTAVGTLMDFLAGCPCDEVFGLLQGFEQEVQADVQRQQAAAQQAAAQKALDDAAANDGAQTVTADAGTGDASVIDVTATVVDTPAEVAAPAADPVAQAAAA